MAISQPEDVADHGGGCGGPGVGQPALQQHPWGREVLVEEMSHDGLEFPAKLHKRHGPFRIVRSVRSLESFELLPG